MATLRGSAPKTRIARFWSKKLTANEVTRSVSASAPRACRNATRSIERGRDDRHPRIVRMRIGHGGLTMKTTP